MKLKTMISILSIGLAGLTALAGQETSEASTLSGRCRLQIPSGWFSSAAGSDPLTSMYVSDALVIADSRKTYEEAFKPGSNLRGLIEKNQFTGAFLIYTCFPLPSAGFDKWDLFESLGSWFGELGEKEEEEYGLAGLEGKKMTVRTESAAITVFLLTDQNRNAVLGMGAYAADRGAEIEKITQSLQYTLFSASAILESPLFDMRWIMPEAGIRLSLPRGFWLMKISPFSGTDGGRYDVITGGNEWDWPVTADEKKALTLKGVLFQGMSLPDPEGKFSTAPAIEQELRKKDALKPLLNEFGHRDAEIEVAAVAPWQNEYGLAGWRLSGTMDQEKINNARFEIYLIGRNGRIVVLAFLVAKKRSGFSGFIERVAAELEPAGDN